MVRTVSIDFTEATPEELPALSSLYKELNRFYSNFDYCLPSPENVGELWITSIQKTLGKFTKVFLANAQNKIVGFLLARIKTTPVHMGGVLVGEISDIWVHPQERGRGIGDQLCWNALKWLKKKQVHSVESQVQLGNDASLKMFKRLGFHAEFQVLRLNWKDLSSRSDENDL